MDKARQHQNLSAKHGATECRLGSFGTYVLHRLISYCENGLKFLHYLSICSLPRSALNNLGHKHAEYITLVAGLLARSQYPEVPATGHLGTGFSWFPCVYKRMLRWFPRLQAATACFSYSPPDFNFLDPQFIFMYTHYNHCHRATGHLQLIYYYYYYYYYPRYLLCAGYLHLYS